MNWLNTFFHPAEQPPGTGRKSGRASAIPPGCPVSLRSNRATRAAVRITVVCLLCLVLWMPGTPVCLYAGDVGTSEQLSETAHSARLDGKKIRYTATAGKLPLTDASGTLKAEIFFVAYEKKGTEQAERPLTFAFNGGPGSSSVWLHMGAMGPQKVVLDSEGFPPPPPARLADNAFSWLAFTDLVFIDPVGTGYSRGTDPETQKKFYDIQKDIASVGDFIRLYLTRYNRWLSPKFLAGESYGSTRAAGLAGYLTRTYGIDLNGIVLISPVLDFDTITFSGSHTLPFALFFPTYTATAWYHNRLAEKPPQLQPLLDEVETWVSTRYIPALFKGNRLSDAGRQEIADSISTYTGLDTAYVLNNSLKIHPSRFRKELLRQDARVAGRMDSRVASLEKDPARDTTYTDPSLQMLIPPFTCVVNYYVRNRLGFEADNPYIHLNSRVLRKWNWDSAVAGSQGHVSLSGSIVDALHANNHLKIFMACGIYDLATPYFAAKYTVSQMDMDKTLRDNIILRFYNAGHMMYTREECLKQLYSDARDFYQQAVH